ncbi:unnamed protein product, partial [Prorocentrum cordatum]
DRAGEGGRDRAHEPELGSPDGRGDVPARHPARLPVGLQGLLRACRQARRGDGGPHYGEGVPRGVQPEH